jgi:hypothetical protein
MFKKEGGKMPKFKVGDVVKCINNEVNYGFLK